MTWLPIYLQNHLLELSMSIFAICWAWRLWIEEGFGCWTVGGCWTYSPPSMVSGTWQAGHYNWWHWCRALLFLLGNCFPCDRSVLAFHPQYQVSFHPIFVLHTKYLRHEKARLEVQAQIDYWSSYLSTELQYHVLSLQDNSGLPNYPDR